MADPAATSLTFNSQLGECCFGKPPRGHTPCTHAQGAQHVGLGGAQINLRHGCRVGDQPETRTIPWL